MATYSQDFTEKMTAKADLAAADSTKTIIAAPREGVQIRVFRAVYISKTSAAQALSVDAGTTNLFDLAASVTVHAVIDTGEMEGGLLMPAATALIATPAAAGPAGSFYVTYRLE